MKNSKIVILTIIIVIISTLTQCNRASKHNGITSEIADTFNLIIYEEAEEKLKKDYLVSDIMPYYSEGLWGYADKEKDIIIKCEYNSCGFFSEGMAWVKKNNKYGYIDTTGVLKIDFIYSNARNFKNGVAPAKRDRYWGFIDSSGNTVTPFLFEDYSIDDEGNIFVLQNNQWGTMDKSGKQLILPIYSNIFHFKDGYAIVKRKYKKGVIDKTGKELIECLHNDIIYAGNETFIIIRKPKYNEMYYGLLNNKGEEIIHQIYDELIAVNEKGIIARKDNLYGLLSYSNDTLIDFVYSNIRNGNTNLLAVNGGKWRFVNLQGDTILPFIYNDAFAFWNGLAKVKKDYKFGVINSKGETIIPFEYDKIEDADNNIFRIYKGEKYGFATTEGKIISECIYDAIDYYESCRFNNIKFGSFINGPSI